MSGRTGVTELVDISAGDSCCHLSVVTYFRETAAISFIPTCRTSRCALGHGLLSYRLSPYWLCWALLRPLEWLEWLDRPMRLARLRQQFGRYHHPSS